ncbi:SGNH/GDSL hydrolase family protein [Lachnospiraceae bacterium OttesenSCG-928-D06]|nr:SGNH/GDSL hydrolase family protein [Lachnospiraceae bacterium OttesenSCG-928-D06]
MRINSYDSTEYQEMVNLLLQLQEKWNVGVIDLWNNDEFNNITDGDRKLYMQDDIHPTMAGYRDWWVPEMEVQILNYLN